MEYKLLNESLLQLLLLLLLLLVLLFCELWASLGYLVRPCLSLI